MKRNRYTDAQIAFALRQHEAGTAVPEIVRKMGSAGRQLALEKFSPERIASDMKQLYTKILEGVPTRHLDERSEERSHEISRRPVGPPRNDHGR